MLLAIDTSAGTSVAVLSESGELVAERSTADTRRHAEVLGEFLAELAPTDVTAVVVGVGPGPFTGLRVGIAAARGFAWGANVPLWPVVSHDAIALEHLERGEAGQFVVATDARRREFFASEYDGVIDGVPRRTAGPQIVAEAAEVSSEVSASALARVAIARVAAGLALEPTDAVYLRNPDVTLSQPKRVSS